MGLGVGGCVKMGAVLDELCGAGAGESAEMPVRLKDIAEDLNLSKMTISKVLRGQTDVSAETKARVLQRAKELNYRPNITARSLRTGQTFSMGLVLPSLGDPYFAELTKGIEQAVRPAGYGLMVCPAEDDLEHEQRQIERLLAHQVDALLVVPVQESAAFFDELSRGGTAPLLFVNHGFPGDARSFVGVDQRRVGSVAAEHLIAAGCRRIAYLRGPRTSTGDLRYAGFREALAEARAAFHPEMVVGRGGAEIPEYAAGFAGMTKLLAMRTRPDGVMAYTDMMAVGAMDAALAQGVAIPGMMAFAGCGNEARICEMRTGLSSVDTAGYEVGLRAGRMALRMRSGETNGAAGRRALVRPRMVRRASSMR